MKYLSVVSLLLLTACFSVNARATDTYEPVPVTIAHSVELPIPLARLLAALMSAADTKDLTTVRSHVGRSFFWDSDHGGGFQASLSPEDNLTNALSLDPTQIKVEYLSANWMVFKTLLEGHIASRHKRGSNILCLPGKGKILNRNAAEKAAKKFGTDPWYGMMFSFGFPAVVRSAPEPGANIVGTIIDEAVIVRHDLRTDPDKKWEPVHLANGARGWVRKDGIRTFLDPQMCFAKGADETWMIVGYNGGGD
ncbi:MAG: hypothetical protein GY927_22235 [bacterium]|nr:hypothetical protein [bacterium]